MFRKVMTEVDVVQALRIVRDNIKTSFLKRPPEISSREPRLVVVSKTKPKELIIAAYNEGQRHFGENYVQELIGKSNDPEVQEKCPEIRWHFIGHLQRNKVNKVAAVPCLYMVETVDSERLASALHEAWSKYGKKPEDRLRIMIQVNTSGEAEKSGCQPDELVKVVQHVMEKCSNLLLVGLMTIGEYGYDCSKGPNPDFQSLIQCRKNVCSELNIPEADMELSMGMSADYEHAIEVGSTNVRVGSTIFGHRQQKA